MLLIDRSAVSEVPMLSAAVRRQNTVTLSSEIVQESDFSDAADNSAYVSDVQSLITKSTLQPLFR